MLSVGPWRRPIPKTMCAHKHPHYYHIPALKAIVAEELSKREAGGGEEPEGAYARACVYLWSPHVWLCVG